MRNPEEHLALADINPELEQIINEQGPIKSLTADTDIPKVRELLNERRKKSLTTTDGEQAYVEEDIQVPVHDGSSIPVRIHKPRNLPEDGCPIFVMNHGGGMCLGGLDSETPFCRKFTELGGIAVNVDYRLAPENPFPIPIQDAYDALKWAAKNFTQLGGNPKKGFLLGGVSAGANFTSIMSHMYRDERLSPPLTGIYLSIPPCVTEEYCPPKYKHLWLSRKQNKDTPILNDESIALFEKAYQSDWTSKWRTPMLFESHADLPPTYFQICGMDPLRDDGMIYEMILREDNGVKTKVDLYPGLPHGFPRELLGSSGVKEVEFQILDVLGSRAALLVPRFLKLSAKSHSNLKQWETFPDAKFSKDFKEDCVGGVKWLLEQGIAI